MEEEAEHDEEAGEQSDDAESDSNGNTHIFDRMSTKLIISLEEIQDVVDEALFDLSADVPPADPPIVQPSKKKTVALRPDRMPYYDACKHDGSDTTSGATESSESSNSMDEWLDKSPVMTSKEQKKVNRFMQKLTGKKRRYK